MFNTDILPKKIEEGSWPSPGLGASVSGPSSSVSAGNSAVRPWKVSVIVMSLLLGLLAATSGIAFDYFLHKDGIPRRDLLVLGNMALGLIMAAVFYRFAKTEEGRRISAERRLAAIGEMNHHVRNALQVISYQHLVVTSSDKAPVISQAVKRIEWALREILPKFPGE